jgi:hypothetical protein
MPNSEFQDSVKQELEQNGWEVLDTGWPDFLCIKNGEIKAIEVKKPADIVRPNQQKMFSVLSQYIPVRIARQGPGFGDSENSENFHLLVWKGDLI